jgi:hypothetical protein
VKTILIILVLSYSGSATVIEFDNREACEAAAKAVQELIRARTVCTPKG